jgi:hypothetical protein
VVKAPEDGAVFDVWDPANISPLVAYLSTEECPFNGATFFVQGGRVTRMLGWRMDEGVELDHRWSVKELAEQLPSLL